MSDLVKSFEYTLLAPITYQHEGQTITADRLIVLAPNARQLDDLAILDQEYQSSVMSMAKHFKDFVDQAAVQTEKKDKDPSDLKEASNVYSVMVGAKSCDTKKVFAAFKRILCHSKPEAVCQVGLDNVGMTAPIFEQLSYHDLKILLGLYINHFLDLHQTK